MPSGPASVGGLNNSGNDPSGAGILLRLRTHQAFARRAPTRQGQRQVLDLPWAMPRPLGAPRPWEQPVTAQVGRAAGRSTVPSPLAVRIDQAMQRCAVKTSRSIKKSKAFARAANRLGWFGANAFLTRCRPGCSPHRPVQWLHSYWRHQQAAADEPLAVTSQNGWLMHRRTKTPSRSGRVVGRVP